MGPAPQETLELAKSLLLQRIQELGTTGIARRLTPGGVSQLPTRPLTEAEMQGMPGSLTGVLSAPPGKATRKDVPNVRPTKVLLLMNLVGAGDVDEDLLEETTEEASKYGKI